MGHLKEDIPLAASCDALLVKVIRIYLEIEALYQSMQNELSATSALKVMQTVGTLNALLQDAQTVDGLIANSLNTVPTLSESTVTLLEKRQEILNRLYQANHEIVHKADNVKSMLRHEIISISTNHNAIKGYKSAGTERKYIIKDSF